MADVKILQSKADGSLWADLPGGQLQPVTPEQATLIRENPGMLSNIVGSAIETGKQGLLGLASFGPDAELAQAPLQRSREETAARGMVSPISTMVGQAAPAIAVGAATQGAGLPAMMGAEALYGAAMSPEEPLVGAALGAAFGAVPFAAQGARAGVQAVGRMLPEGGALGESLRTATSVIPGRNKRMTDSVMEKLGQVEGEAKPPVLSGYLSPKELDAAGIPYTRGDAMSLLARSDDEMKAAATVRNMEELQRSGVFGNTTNAIRDAQKTGFTQYIKKELGIAADDARALTDTRMGEIFQGLGKQFDEIRSAAGPEVRMGERFGNSLKALVDNAEPDTQARLAKLVDGIFQKNGGDTGPITLSQKSIGDIERQLGKMVDVGINHGNYALLSDAMFIRMQIREAVERQLPDKLKGEMQKLRKQYALASSLTRKGVRDVAGEINPASLRNSWNLNPNYSKKQIGQDDLGRALETAAYLTSRVVPSSGTSERLLANMPNAMVKAVPGVGMAALGADAILR